MVTGTESKGLFIFRRDLRAYDNTSLNLMLDSTEESFLAFIFDPRQVEGHQYKSLPGLSFLIDSLRDLAEDLKKSFGVKLHLFYGKAEEIVDELIEKYKFDVVGFNKDYTPFSKVRDGAIESVCKGRKVEVISEHDAMLFPPDRLKTTTGTPFTVFTPFYKRGMKEPKILPKTSSRLSEISKEVLSLSADKMSELDSFKDLFPLKNELRGGRQNALKILTDIKNYKNYTEIRDVPSIRGTTYLSAHQKFGTVSPREIREIVSKALGDEHPIVRQLFWRDFYTQITVFFPHVYGEAFNKKYSNVEWDQDTEKFQQWCEGKTGFPIVDAGMRELNATGFMHNRLRMITASFLVKDLHIDWRWGEKYFATKLVDYDPAVNNGNWQWVASTGCDAAPYFRVFNPWLQGERFDPEAIYITKWVTELDEIDSEFIHDPEGLRPANYPLPMVDHKFEAAEAIDRYGK